MYVCNRRKEKKNTQRQDFFFFLSLCVYTYTHIIGLGVLLQFFGRRVRILCTSFGTSRLPLCNCLLGLPKTFFCPIRLSRQQDRVRQYMNWTSRFAPAVGNEWYVSLVRIPSIYYDKTKSQLVCLPAYVESNTP